jgi:uncharacterized protein involved in exopolysaccharide biosynthesis
MTEGEGLSGDEFSLLAFGTTLLRQRWRIVRWMAIGAAIAALLVFARRPLYTASASFVPKGGESGGSGLASLAGQFGLTLPTGNQSTSPDFYVRLIKSRVVLETISRDTFVVSELGGQRVSVLDLFDIKGENRLVREEQGIKTLAGRINAVASKTTGLVELAVQTRWPSVSLAISAALIDGVNDYNRRTRQGQAAAERKFVENRLGVAATDLRAAEDRLENFLRDNRQCCGAPELTFQRDRLQRDITLRQQVFTSLTQSYEEVRIREVRDTPVITVVEAPSLPSRPDPRWRMQGTLLGAVLGAFVGALLALVSEAIARRKEAGDADVDLFMKTWDQIKSGIFRRGRRGRAPAVSAEGSE